MPAPKPQPCPVTPRVLDWLVRAIFSSRSMYVDRSGQLCSARDTTGHAQLHDIGCCMTAALWLLVLPPRFLQLNGVPSLVVSRSKGARRIQDIVGIEREMELRWIYKEMR